MKIFSGFDFYRLMGWWLSKNSITRDFLSSVVGIAISALVFGFIGVRIDDLIQNSTARFIFWTAIGSLLLKFMFSIGTALAEEYERVKKLSIHDPLTGLHSIAYLPEAITITFTHAQRHKEYFCVFVFDGNKIKDINDKHGHEIGNKAIKKIAQKIQEAVYRRDDIIIRFGGDEFVVICSSKDPDKMYQRMLNFIGREIIMPINDDNDNIILSVAIGMSSMLIPEKSPRGKSPEEIYQILFVEADGEMYKNKEVGR